MNINKVLEKMQKDITTLSQRLNHHEHNLGKNAHQVAYGGNSGFIDYDLYQKIFQEHFIRKTINADVDVFSLESGSYIVFPQTYNVRNLPKATITGLSPVDGTVLVDVRPYGGGRKVIRCIPTWHAAEYICTLHTNGATSGWRKFRELQQVFRGNTNSSVSSDVNFSFTVTENTVSYITFTGASPAGNAFSVTSPFSYKQRTLSKSNAWVDGGRKGISVDELTITWSATSFNLKNPLRVSIDSSGSTVNDPASDWVINAVFVE